MMGIKEWLVPQISEHCPENNPKRFEVMKVWFRRPGRASTLIPMDGTLHLWITSIEETRARVVLEIGMKRVSLVFRRRYELEFSIKHSISLFMKVLYS